MKAHAPVPYDKLTLYAVKALREGKASEGQQKLAMAWIENVVCNVEGMSWHDDAEGGERASSFHEGRRFVGNQIRKMSHPLTLASLEKAEANADKRPRGRRTREAKTE